MNRLAPLIGLAPLHAARNLPRRVKADDGRSRVQRVCEGSVPFDAVSRFPSGVRQERGRAADYYTGCNTQLDVTGLLADWEREAHA